MNKNLLITSLVALSSVFSAAYSLYEYHETNKSMALLRETSALAVSASGAAVNTSTLNYNMEVLRTKCLNYGITSPQCEAANSDYLTSYKEASYQIAEMERFSLENVEESKTYLHFQQSWSWLVPLLFSLIIFTNALVITVNHSANGYRRDPV